VRSRELVGLLSRWIGSAGAGDRLTEDEPVAESAQHAVHGAH
jgi:hypothetical protein